MKSHLVKTLLSVLAMVVLTACGNGEISYTGMDEEQAYRPDGGTYQPDTGGSDACVEGEPGCGEVGDADVGGVPTSGCFLLSTDPDRELMVNVDGEVDIEVLVLNLDPVTGVTTPVPGRQLRYEIISEELEGTFLITASAQSDADGTASATLQSGETTGRVTVEVTTESGENEGPCNATQIDVEVLELPAGDFDIRVEALNANSVINPVEFELRGYGSDLLRCTDLRPNELPAASYYGDPVMPGEDEQVQSSREWYIEDVITGQGYTFIAIGRDINGVMTHYACADNNGTGFLAYEDEVEEITIPMGLVPPEPAGVYDTYSWWDFRCALSESGSTGATIVEVINLFNNPGAGIYGFLLDAIEGFVGGIIAGAIEWFFDLVGLDSVIENAINDLIDSVPFLSDMFTVLQDLGQVISSLEIIGELEIRKLSSSGRGVLGREALDGIGFYWRLGCEDNEAGEECRRELDLDIYDLDFISGDWTGQLRDPDSDYGNNWWLDVDTHPLDFDLGRLILYIIEWELLPSIIGEPAPVTFEDVMIRVINCDGIGDVVAGGDGDCRCALGACICDDDVEGFCEDFIGFTFGGLFRGFLNAFGFSAVLDTQMDVALINDNSDRRIEYISGNYSGIINIDGYSPRFTAPVCGVRQDHTVRIAERCPAERPTPDELAELNNCP